MKKGFTYFFLSLSLFGCALLSCGISAEAFTPGNLVVCRVGDGSSVLGSRAAPVFIDEYTPAGVFVSSLAMPTSANGANMRLTVSGTAQAECQITRSADGRFILVPGYNAPLDLVGFQASSATDVARVIGRMDWNATVSTATALSDALDGGSVRGAASTNGTDMWISGNGTGNGVSAVRYAVFGSTTSTPVTPSTFNLRALNIFGGQLYVSAGTGSSVPRMHSVGVGLPTTAGQALSAFAGIPTSVSFNSFFLADLSPNIPGVDTLYAADDVGDVIRKYSFNGTAWTASGTVPLPDAAGLTGSVNGSSVMLYVTSPTSLGALSDTSGYNAAINGTLSVLAHPADLTEFRSVAFAPLSPSTVSVSWGTRSYMRRVTVTATNARRIYFKLPFMTDFQFVEGNFVRLKVLRQSGGWGFEAFAEDMAGNRTNSIMYSMQ
ncbi:MAG: hypothetical protein ABI999_10235 [Acidobacteriota bacterium]